MERLLRAALAATMSILLVAGGSLALTQASPDDLATLQAAPWTLSELDGQAIDAEAGITAAFGADGSLTGSAGCNQYTSDYQVSGEFLSVGPIAATRKACDQDVMDTEDEFLDLLENADSYALEGGALVITSFSGGVLVFGGEDTAEPAPFAGTEWMLQRMNLLDVAELGATAVFSEEFAVAGFAGCNDYNGGYSIDGDSIAIGPLAATRKACDQEVMDLEDEFLLTMELADTVSISGQTLTLATSDGSGELVFSTGGGAAPTAAPTGSLAGVEWTLVDLDGDPAVIEDGMVVTFGEDGKIDGFGGCNTIFGEYSTDGSELIIAGLAATRKFCDPELMDRELLYIAILTQAVEWQVTGDQLRLTDEDGSELLFTSAGAVGPTPGPVATPVAPSGSIVGPVWQLAVLQGTEMPTEFISVTISFAADGSVTGNAGCNDFTGTYTLDGDEISIDDIETVSTNSCDTALDSVETGLLQILPFVDSATVVDGALHLDSSFGVESTWEPL